MQLESRTLKGLTLKLDERAQTFPSVPNQFLSSSHTTAWWEKAPAG